eukprot:gene3895-13965_t
MAADSEGSSARGTRESAAVHVTSEPFRGSRMAPPPPQPAPQSVRSPSKGGLGTRVSGGGSLVGGESSTTLAGMQGAGGGKDQHLDVVLVGAAVTATGHVELFSVQRGMLVGGKAQHLDVVLVGAAGPASGHVELFSVQRGKVSPLSVSVATSLSVHADTVPSEAIAFSISRKSSTSMSSNSTGSSVSGATPPITPGLVTFTSERTAQGYQSGLTITDMGSRCSLPFREVANEAHPMVGIRTSPGGNYILVLMMPAPC